MLLGQEDLEFSGEVSKETIDFLTRKIRTIETYIKNKVKMKIPFKYLDTIPGIGKVLSLTIMLETGPVDRFPKVGNYASYCRKVPTGWISNGKKKGKGNKKNGNRYLAWVGQWGQPLTYDIFLEILLTVFFSALLFFALSENRSLALATAE